MHFHRKDADNQPKCGDAASHAVNQIVFRDRATPKKPFSSINQPKQLLKPEHAR
jgi:hypothetical protein